jgi:cytochrome P450/uncharacterized protein (DUF2236 family)
MGFDDGIREAVPMPVDDEFSTATPRLGADSLVWKFYGDIRGLLGFQRLAGTENCVEQLGKAVEDHSVIFSDTVGRARRSGPPIMKTVYSADPQRWGRTVRDFHRPIKGTISDGSRYHALNPELFYWAHATFVDQVLYITDTFIRRLSYEEKVRIFEESKIWYRLYGVSDRGQPQTYEQFVEYWNGMLERFVSTRTIRYGTGYLRKGLPKPKWLPALAWRVATAPLHAFLRTVIVGTLPPQMRAVCDLPWDDRKERRFQRFAATMRALNPLFNRLPVRMLYLPWAAEAWRRVGVDPRGLHNGSRRAPAVLATPPAGSGLRPIYGTGTPGLLEALRLFRNPLGVIIDRRERFGDITYLESFGMTSVLPLTASGCEEVALNREKVFAAEPAWGYLIGPFFRRGILLMDFEEHRYHRLILQQAFTTAHLKGYLQEMQPMIRERVAALPAGDDVRLLTEFKKLTLDVALEIFLGLKLPRAEADRINQAFIACVDAGMSLIRKPIPGTKWARGLAGRKVLEEFMYRHLPDKRARHTPDLFSTLCHISSEDGHTFTDEDVVNHMIFVLMAAHDTSTITMTTMAYFMARHPEWQQRARAQSASLPPEIGYDTLPEFTVLDAIMKESLRLNAPVPGLARQAIEDTHIGDYFVPKGAYVSALPGVVHHHSGLWTNPDLFDPDRFSPQRAEDKSHRFAWMPFGGGVHKCIGLYFAQLEIKTIMHHLLLTHEWSVPPGYQWRLNYATLPVPKDGLPVRLRTLS